MAAGTIVGNREGQDYALDHIYGAWWFTLLWAIGVAAGIVYFLRRWVLSFYVVLLHLSFVVILVGAALTHFTASGGMIHLRQGETATTYTDAEGESHELPFTVKLKQFRVDYHAGTSSAMDYASVLSVNGKDYTVSMNHIYDHHGTRLYQSSYDEDMRGSWLSVNADPWGIPVTYTGYGLLFFALLWMLVDKRGRFRRLLRSPLLKAAAIALLLLAPMTTKAQKVLPKETADRFGRLYILYNGRICPAETFAIDFTKKLYGRAGYKGFTASQVVTGFMFFPEDWMQQPVLKLKGGQLRERLGLEKYAAPAAFFNDMEGYRLGQFLADAQGKNDKFSQQVLDMDDKLMLLMQLTQGTPLRLFPYQNRKAQVSWYAPTDQLPQDMPKAQQQYIHSILLMAKSLAQQNNMAMENELLDKTLKYQQRYGATTLPTKAQVSAERIYNHVPFASILFMLNLTLGFLSAFFFTRRHGYGWFTLLMGLSFLCLTFALALRWIISGTIPMGNGYETMLVMAWLIMLVALLTTRRLRIMTTFGLLMSGFMLLVSHIGEMDPAITPRMPVLNSPLLSIHVSIIMMAYALLSLTFITSLAWLCLHRIKKPAMQQLCRQLTLLSQIFHYPAMTCLGMGIFIGAIWANISWGTYWSWDPKETWALITFMIYAVPLHRASLPALRHARTYNIYMALAFLSILITYFGVNYFLGGMHSYA